MNKADLINALKDQAEGIGTKKAAEDAVNTMVDIMSDAIRKEGSFRLDKFGTFKVTERSARKGRNPRTGEEIQIPAGKAVKFVPSKVLKDSV